MSGKLDLEQYLREKGVHALLQDLTDAIATHRPEDPCLFAYQKLAEKRFSSAMEAPHESMPKWNNPAESVGLERWTGLRLINSFTKSKTPFIPADPAGKKVKWYICGPTVYDSANVGHARNYVAFDIARRILTDYFNYDVQYIMNVTDLDDKIIMRSHKRHLESVLAKVEAGEWRRKTAIQVIVKQQGVLDHTLELVQAIAQARATLAHEEKNIPLLMSATKALVSAAKQQAIVSVVGDLDMKECNIQEAYLKLANQYEKEFFDDMEALGVRTPDAITRVSEYMEEIIEYIKKIMDNGYAYESNGSVYFDVNAFKEGGLCYGKLDPTKVGSAELIAEGEGALSLALGDKKSSSDFALWKASKAGEPAWESPFGKGRPGWHIECSCMCSSILGEEVDINCGGVDLKFPHHDNQLAQSEAYYGVKQWVNYFLHSGHLHIKGMKMSKSLKNFVTIQQALEKYTARQLRMLFVVNPFFVPMDFSDESMTQALTAEKKFNEFFLSLKALLRKGEEQPFNESGFLVTQVFAKDELDLMDELTQARQGVHDAFCDSLNTKLAVERLLQLTSAANSYMSKAGNGARLPLLQNIAIFLTRILSVMGLGSKDAIGFPSSHGAGESTEETLGPYLNAMSRFRDDIRKAARSNKDTAVLALCDGLRDDIMPELGVRLEDQGEGSVWKLDDKETLLKEREIKRQEAEEKRRLKEERLRKEQAKKDLEQKRLQVPAEQMFHPQYNELFGRTDGYEGYTFDDDGLPIKDPEGNEVSKKLAKKLAKEQQKHRDARTKAGLETAA